VSAALADQRGMVFDGTAIVQGTGRALVTATGLHTEMGAIAAMLDATPQAPTPLQREMGRMLGVGVVVIAVAAWPTTPI